MKCPLLLEIHNLYEDFNRLITMNSDVDEITEHIDFIIQKAKLSTDESIRTIGKTFESFRTELINTYSIVNYLQVTNSVAEGNNHLIDEIINVSFGLKDFNRLRNRIFHIKNALNEDKKTVAK